MNRLGDFSTPNPTVTIYQVLRVPSEPTPDTILTRTDRIFIALLGAGVYEQASSHDVGVERLFEMLNRYFKEN